MERFTAKHAPPSPAAIWLMAIRPFSLAISIAPVAAGAALAWTNAGRVQWPAALAAAAAAALIQIGTNFYNDAADYLHGAHRSDRAGPLSVIAQGLLTAPALIRAAWLSFAGAALFGLYLVYFGGWPILVLGMLSIVCGWAYSGGPLPIAYTPLGELFVIAFFGLGAAGGTYWLCTGTLDTPAIVCGLALGSFGAAVLLVNNYRDINEDKRVGRFTLAIAIGPKASRALYAAMMAAPFGLLALLARLLPHTYVWAAFASAPLAALLVGRLYKEPPGPGLTNILIQTVQTQTLFTALLCVGVLYQRT
ncbi:MAG: 1,4-dihydroxy-2-naphthoate octaprenyltransferase [Rhodomicrobium sp.]